MKGPSSGGSCPSASGAWRAAHFDDVYGATVSQDTIGRIAEKVAGGDDGVGQPPARSRLPGDLRGRDRGQGP